jgi:D-alanine-D-alanine ligase
MGGVSRERDISIESGKCVADALKQAGVNVVVADVKPDQLDILEDKNIDVFFIALHGRWGEDGALQEILESRGLIYTGSGSQASRLAFDKWESKKYFTAAGVPTPEAILFEPKLKDLDSRFRGNDNRKDKAKDGFRQFGERYVVKPLREGSTIGVSIADQPRAAMAAAESCAAEFGDCMIERFISGREVTVGILGNEALPIIEIRSQGGFYDYQAKYLDDRTEYLFDTIDNPALVTRIQKSAIDCFNSLGCRGIGRVDFIIGDDGRPYVLEINTIPGMTNHSLLPKAAAKAGISMSRLCLRIVEMALADARLGEGNAGAQKGKKTPSRSRAAIHRPAVRRR